MNDRRTVFGICDEGGEFAELHSAITSTLYYCVEQNKELDMDSVYNMLERG